jgi:hypothetical protein
LLTHLVSTIFARSFLVLLVEVTESFINDLIEIGSIGGRFRAGEQHRSEILKPSLTEDFMLSAKVGGKLK